MRQLPLEHFIEPEPNTGCWIWLGSYDGHKGYGRVATARPFCKSRAAHRVVFTAYRGPIPDGLQLDHRCRNRWCVNPAHLEPVTCRVNLLRGNTLASQNVAKTTCPRGHPYSGSNVNGSRICRPCGAAQLREARALRTSQ